MLIITMITTRIITTVTISKTVNDYLNNNDDTTSDPPRGSRDRAENRERRRSPDSGMAGNQGLDPRFLVIPLSSIREIRRCCTLSIISVLRACARHADDRQIRRGSPDASSFLPSFLFCSAPFSFPWNLLDDSVIISRDDRSSRRSRPDVYLRTSFHRDFRTDAAGREEEGRKSF